MNNEINKNLKLNILTGSSFVFVILTSWANLYQYGSQVFITIMLNEFILLAFASFHHFTYQHGSRENFKLKALLLEVSAILSSQSVLVERQSTEIKKLKRIIDGQINNMGSVRSPD